MIPNPSEVSAFAVYSGLVGVSKSRQRRNRQKQRLLKKSAKKINGKASWNVDKLNKINKTSDSRPKTESTKLSKVNSESKQSINDLLTKTNSKSVVEVSNGSVKRQQNSSSIKLSKKMKLSDLENSAVLSGKSKAYDQKRTTSRTTPRTEASTTSTTGVKDSDCLPFIKSVTQENTSKGNRRRETVVERIVETVERRDRKEKSRKLKAKNAIKAGVNLNSCQLGKTVFESLISPYTAEVFFSKNWEKTPLYIDRSKVGAIYSEYLSTAEIDMMFRNNVLMFGRNVDVTSYTNGVRETHNPEGRAHSHVLWDYYSNGCSVRILNPQTYLDKIHKLLAELQEYFGCFVGSNIYLTPPSTQGFAPHYDDIEAFVLQVEGEKRWRVYKPKSSAEELPRYSSGNFKQDEIGSPILDIILKPGDLLYFPRGFIHQAEALPNQHSLHITISTYQKTSWFDLMEKVLPVALAKACEKNIEYRRGLPIGYLREVGLANPQSSLRSEMLQNLKRLVTHLEKHLDIDDAVDKLGVTFVHQSLPPLLSNDEAKRTVNNGGLKMSEGTVVNRVDLSTDTKIRWIRANAIRIVDDKEEEGLVRLYHSVDNSKEYEGEEPQFVVLDRQLLPALLYLVKSYPAYVSVSQLPCSTDDEKLVLAGDLWDRGLLANECPLLRIEEVLSE